MPQVLQIILIAAAALAGLGIGFIFGIIYRKKTAEKAIKSAEAEATRILNDAIKLAETKKRESLLEAKEEILRNKNEQEKELKERRAELTKQERRIQQREKRLTRSWTPSTQRKKF